MKSRRCVLVISILICLLAASSCKKSTYPKQITSDGAYKSCPRWSRDGKSIAYVGTSAKDSIWQIYLMPSQGGKSALLTKGREISIGSFAWSPDGHEIVFSGFRPGQTPQERAIYKIYKIRVDSAQQITELFTDGYCASPAWSPDGKQIVFARSEEWPIDSDTPEDSHIWLVDSDGANPEQLTFGDNLDFVPVWSPIGMWIAFLRCFEYTFPDAVTDDLTFHALCCITPEKRILSILFLTEAHLSLLGKQSWFCEKDPDKPPRCIIAFEHGEQIWLLRLGDTPLIPSPLTSAKWSTDEEKKIRFRDPDWSPDGKRIVCVGDKIAEGWRVVSSDLYVIDVPHTSQ